VFLATLRTFNECSGALMRGCDGIGGVPLPHDGIVVSSSYDRLQPPLTVVLVDDGGRDVGLE